VRLISDDTWAILTIRGEGASEPFAGKVAIGITIRNRMRHRYASDGTVVGTVLRPHQFSMWRYPHPWIAMSDDEDTNVRECSLAWEESEGSTLLPGDVVLYHTAQKPTTVTVWPPSWAAPMRFVRQVGAHLFYADPKIAKG
jgi:spore germination cell wall hydrolase CwlJ-like protein